jgi:hypothetical protein
MTPSDLPEGFTASDVLRTLQRLIVESDGEMPDDEAVSLWRQALIDEGMTEEQAEAAMDHASVLIAESAVPAGLALGRG